MIHCLWWSPKIALASLLEAVEGARRSQNWRQVAAIICMVSHQAPVCAEGVSPIFLLDTQPGKVFPPMRKKRGDGQRATTSIYSAKHEKAAAHVARLRFKSASRLSTTEKKNTLKYTACILHECCYLCAFNNMVGWMHTPTLRQLDNQCEVTEIAPDQHLTMGRLTSGQPTGIQISLSTVQR